jgi:pectinesterase
MKPMGMEFKHDDDDNLHIFNSKLGEEMNLVFDMENDGKNVFTTEERKIFVSRDGSGDCKTIGDAFEYAEKLPHTEPVIIMVKNGRYFEKLRLCRPNVTLIGEDAEKTIIENNSAAKDVCKDGNALGTYETATVHIIEGSDNFKCKNITFVNSAGLGKFVGQAIALYVDCDKAVFDNCRILANQDTLLAAPNHIDYDSENDKLNRMYFKDCYIEGNVDFIFGGATAVFDNCEIFCRKREDANKSYVTACCTPKNSAVGFVFRNCSITGDADEHTVYLGRPWREYAKAAFINCSISSVVNGNIFIEWNDTDKHKNSCYEICNCTGEAMENATPVQWCHLLAASEAEDYTNDEIFGNWNPEADLI